jgi:hypothetical protein
LLMLAVGGPAWAAEEVPVRTFQFKNGTKVNVHKYVRPKHEEPDVPFRPGHVIRAETMGGLKAKRVTTRHGVLRHKVQQEWDAKQDQVTAEPAITRKWKTSRFRTYVTGSGVSSSELRENPAAIRRGVIAKKRAQEARRIAEEAERQLWP